MWYDSCNDREMFVSQSKVHTEDPHSHGAPSLCGRDLLRREPPKAQAPHGRTRAWGHRGASPGGSEEESAGRQLGRAFEVSEVSQAVRSGSVSRDAKPPCENGCSLSRFRRTEHGPTAQASTTLAPRTSSMDVSLMSSACCPSWTSSGFPVMQRAGVCLLMRQTGRSTFTRPWPT